MVGRRLIPCSCKEIERKLLVLGFKFDHSKKGSERYYLKEKNNKQFLVSIHWHPGDKDPSTIRSIMRNGDISRKEWFEA